MNKFRARICPRCNYFLGFSLAKPLADGKEAAVTSFCLNCSYRLPVHGVTYGLRRATLPLRRARLKLAAIINRKQRSDSHGNEAAENSVSTTLSKEYSRDLRVIGQELEKQGIESFNLDCTAGAYRIWRRDDNALSHPAGARSDHWWRAKGQPQELSRVVKQTTPRLSYCADELSKMEDVAKTRRTPNGEVADGHSLSHLLRTIGSLVKQKNDRLLAISWRDLTVCIVIETARGKREIDVFRPDNLYDLWVRMYLRRENRALSDVPS